MNTSRRGLLTVAVLLAVTTLARAQGDPDFVPVSQRLATFDNDGTLWSEQPKE
jgi:hypothetical protein